MKSNKDKLMKENKNTEIPSFVYRDGMTANKEYVEWLSDLKRRYKQSQLRTAVKANSEVLEYYWSLGRDIVAKEAESKWGSGFFNQLSLDIYRNHTERIPSIIHSNLCCPSNQELL